MTSGAGRRLAPGDRLPPLTLLNPQDRTPQELRSTTRDAVVLVFTPAEAELEPAQLRGLEQGAGEVEHWYARLHLVLSGDRGRAAELRARLEGRLSVLYDEGGEAAAAIGLDRHRVALVIADRYGQVYEIAEAGARTLPAVADIEGWVRFLAMQCPECGVIDEPGHGEWEDGGEV